MRYFLLLKPVTPFLNLVLKNATTTLVSSANSSHAVLRLPLSVYNGVVQSVIKKIR